MTPAQRRRLNAMCGDLERQVVLVKSGHYIHRDQILDGALDRVVDKDSWRWIFCGTYKGWKTVPAIEGAGFVMLGASSKNLTVEEASDVMEMIAAFGDERGVQWSEPEAMEAKRPREAEHG